MTPNMNNDNNYFFELNNQILIREPVLISMCLLGIPCRWHGRRAKKRDNLISRLKKQFVMIPVCPEQIGGMPTPRTSETLQGKSGIDVLDKNYRLIAPETGKDVTQYHIKGSEYVLELAQILEAKRAYLKGGSPSCDKDGITGELYSTKSILSTSVP